MPVKGFERSPLDVLMSCEEGKFYAHCLPFDLLAEGETEKEARIRLAEMIFEYIRFYLEKNMEQFIFRPAPIKYWEILRAVREKKHFIPSLPVGLLEVSSANRVQAYLNPVNAPACA
ncbi:MAG: hypothetical protein A3G87_02385 [Omnitrophica bacterium RIFCSPLOWO2_12_FULL_50_11]|nr:MAG: hypothetical protein A3G87_02385 [Omnitrophica bacterium RIFCSPLOWO2_12_FULL_50_11]